MKHTIYDTAKLTLDRICQNIGIDKPANYDEILKFMVNDMEETADPQYFNSQDAAIAFRRFLESEN